MRNFYKCFPLLLLFVVACGGSPPVTRTSVINLQKNNNNQPIVNNGTLKRQRITSEGFSLLHSWTADPPMIQRRKEVQRRLDEFIQNPNYEIIQVESIFTDGYRLPEEVVIYYKER